MTGRNSVDQENDQEPDQCNELYHPIMMMLLKRSLLMQRITTIYNC